MATKKTDDIGLQAVEAAVGRLRQMIAMVNIMPTSRLIIELVSGNDAYASYEKTLAALREEEKRWKGTSIWDKDDEKLVRLVEQSYADLKTYIEKLTAEIDARLPQVTPPTPEAENQ